MVLPAWRLRCGIAVAVSVTAAADLDFLPAAAPQTGRELAGQHLCDGSDVAWEACPEQPECEQCKPVDCEFNAWASWYDGGGCTGLRMRHRTVRVANNHCGKPCHGPQTMTEQHLKEACKLQETDCSLSIWSEWTQCTSAFGQAERHREVNRDASPGGKPCSGATSETRPCSPGPEPTPCQFSEWQSWTACSATCGTGQHERGRVVLRGATHGGKSCQDAVHETGQCTERECEVRDCHVTDWSHWSSCQQGEGQRNRHRTILQEPVAGGVACPPDLKVTEGCPEASASDCKFTEWSSWRDCDKSCAGGQTFRHRRILNDHTAGGLCERSSLKEVHACNIMPCMTDQQQDCVMSEWEPWSECSSNCGKGSRARGRKVVSPASRFGTGCDGALKETEACMSDRDCQRVDCRWSEWYEWSACSLSCGGGQKRRTHVIAVAPRNDGKLCSTEDKSEVLPCNTMSCNDGCIDGLWGEWMDWTPCSATCASAFKMRRRDLAVAPSLCGKLADGLREDFAVCAELPSCVQDADCQLSDWGEWGQCTCSCFGVQERNRYISVFASGKGKPCEDVSLKEVEPCNPGLNESAPLECGIPPKADCELSEWSGWEACTAECGGGQMTRKRTVLKMPQAGGAECGKELVSTKPCNTMPCTPHGCQDCVWDEWAEWGACSKCGGQRFRHRAIRKLPNQCGKRCEAHAAKEISTCTSHCESVMYCSWAEWSSSMPCNDECGTSTTLRTRAMTLSRTASNTSADSPLYIFKGDDESKCAGTQLNMSSCPFSRSCTKACVPQHCTFGVWSDWQEPTCLGLCERQRQIETAGNACGQPCSGAMVETKRCSARCDVPQDCLLSEWRDWAGCFNPGSGEQQFRHREVVRMPEHGGAACVGALRETEDCTDANSESCRFSAWSEWGACSTSCGRGRRSQTRSILGRSTGAGLQCKGTLERLGTCLSNATCSGEVSDCEFGDWGDWSACGIGVSQRSSERHILQDASNGGRSCSGTLRHTEACLTPPVDCQVEEWSEWSECDKTCGAGGRTRQRKVGRFAENGGTPCPHVLAETMGCNNQECGAQDAKVSGWSDWGDCSAQCGVGSKRRSREVTRLRRHGGLAADLALAEVRACTGQSAECGIVDCKWGDWMEWAGCSCSCGGGQRTRKRTIAAMPRNGGKFCVGLDREEMGPCNMHSCDIEVCVDGRWAEWGEWGACSASCEGGTTIRHRTFAEMANACGKVAEGMNYESMLCNQDVFCDVAQDCKFSQWSQWVDCTASCNGVSRRVRGIDVYGKGDGAWCKGATEEIQPCNPGIAELPTPECGQRGRRDCEFADWQPWGECSATCGGGEYRRHRAVAQSASGGGAGCQGALAEIGECGKEQCPGAEVVDCKFSDWQEWGACSKCSGERMRYRHVLEYATSYGANCEAGDLRQIADCPRVCGGEHYCVWDGWEAWSSCSNSCGPGKRQRRRSLQLSGSPGSEDLLPSMDELMRQYAYLDVRTKALEAHRFEELSIAFGAGCMALVVGILGYRSVALLHRRLRHDSHLHSASRFAAHPDGSRASSFSFSALREVAGSTLLEADADTAAPLE